MKFRTMLVVLLATQVCLPFPSYGQADIAASRQKAERGDADAQCNLGLCYAKGKGVPQDYKEAVKWFRLSAEQGNADAQRNLGVCYANGTGVPQDSSQAYAWINLAAAQGDKSAIELRATMLQGTTPSQIEEGQRRSREIAKGGDGPQAYKLAAEQGNADAQCNLGLCYAKGKGVPQDYKEAVKWFRFAAEQGNADAQRNLGVCYANGTGVPQDYAQAYAWINLAAAQGDKSAIELRATMLQGTTPSQIEEGQRRSREIAKGGRDETLEFIQPPQRFLDSIVLVREEHDDLGGKSVASFVSWLSEVRHNAGKPIKIKGWKQDNAFYELYVELDEPIVLKFLKQDGLALMQPVKIYNRIIDPMEFVMLMKGEMDKPLKTTDASATVRFECNASEFQIFENNRPLITSDNNRLAISPFKEHILEIRATGYKPQAVTIKAAKPGQDLGVKSIELLRTPPPGGDPNAVSWQVINEQWIKNTYKNGHITMGDRRSGNMWVYDSTESGKRDWDSAVEYCNTLNYAGYSDWRLPEKEDLHEIYKQKRLFPSTRDNSYWSSKFDANDSESAWGVCMIDDCVGNVSKRGRFYAWPVRSLK